MFQDFPSLIKPLLQVFSKFSCSFVIEKHLGDIVGIEKFLFNNKPSEFVLKCFKMANLTSVPATPKRSICTLFIFIPIFYIRLLFNYLFKNTQSSTIIVRR